MTKVDDLYETAPDRLLTCYAGDTWYAFYDYDLAVLSNAAGDLVAYYYSDKTEYRAVRRFITETYNVKETSVTNHDEDFR